MKKFNNSNYGNEVMVISGPFEGARGIIKEVVQPNRFLALVQIMKSDGTFHPTPKAFAHHELENLTQISRDKVNKGGEYYYKNVFAEPKDGEEQMKRIQSFDSAKQPPHQNPILLHELYYNNHNSLSEIARKFNVHQKTISNWMNYYGFQRRDVSSALTVYHHGDMAQHLRPIDYNPTF